MQDALVISPETVNQHFQGDQYISLFLGYPRIDVLQKLNEIRQAAIDDRCCWSHQYSDQEMMRYIKHFKQLSIEIEHNCKQVALQFIDVSEN